MNDNKQTTSASESVEIERFPKGKPSVITHDLIDENNYRLELESQVENLKAEKAFLTAALKHYADKNNWLKGNPAYSGLYDWYQIEGNGWEVAQQALEREKAE